MNIGENLKRIRVANSLTQQELADRCELTKGYISQLERDLTSPSIATLTDILECLGTDLASFFNEAVDNKIVFKHDDVFVKESDDNYIINWIVPNAQKNEMEPILLTLPPKGKSHEMQSHFGEEFGYVLKGTVTLVRDNKKYKLKAKDTFYMSGKTSHYLYNHGNSEALILWVTNPPMF